MIAYLRRTYFVALGGRARRILEAVLLFSGNCAFLLFYLSISQCPSDVLIARSFFCLLIGVRKDLERMAASTAYWKGLQLRGNPR